MENKIPEKMLGMKLPGGAKVQAVEVDVPHPGPGQVLLKMKAASLCGCLLYTSPSPRDTR